MKAAMIEAFTQDTSGVAIRDVPPPRPGPEEVLVRMHKAPINPSEFNYIHGTYQTAFSRMAWNRGASELREAPGGQVFPLPPYGLGVEGVGTVEEAGKSLLARRLAGKRVAVAVGPPHGTWRELTVVDARRAFPVAASLDDAQACSFFVNPLTAVVLVRHVLAVPKGAVVLQTAAGSALGQMVRNLAKLDGFRVIDVVRSRAGAKRLEAEGRRSVIALEDDDLLDAVRKLAPDGVDFVLDCVGGDTGGTALRTLTLGGRMVCYGTLSREPISLPPRDIMMSSARVEGFYLAAYLAKRSLLQRLLLVRTTAKLLERGVLATPVEATYSLDRVHEALAHAQRPGRSGKILLDLS